MDSTRRLQPLVRNIDKALYIFDRKDDLLSGSVNDSEDIQRIVTFKESDPYRWNLFISTDDTKLVTDLESLNDKIAIFNYKNQKVELSIYNNNGEEIYSMGFPVGSSARFLMEKTSGNE